MSESTATIPDPFKNSSPNSIKAITKQILQQLSLDTKIRDSLLEMQQDMLENFVQKQEISYKKFRHNKARMMPLIVKMHQSNMKIKK